jgi:5'-nucleotidase (lipoprotein e(P4) family)
MLPMKGLLVLLAATAAACAPAVSPASAPAPAPVAAPAAAEALPRDVHWFRNAAEQRAAFVQAYRLAGDQLRQLSAGRAAGTWAVILDADETVLDNSTYQKERAAIGAPFTPESWNAWVRRAAAPALPGAAEFIRMVRERGGRVVIVTNRDEVVCAETRENLRRLSIRVEGVLCKPEGPSDKNPRFAAVQGGTAVPGLPALEVLMWVGDNIQDFPGLTQAIRLSPESAFERFGRSFIVLPNPMYGSWERNPMN